MHFKEFGTFVTVYRILKYKIESSKIGKHSQKQLYMFLLRCATYILLLKPQNNSSTSKFQRHFVKIDWNSIILKV